MKQKAFTLIELLVVVAIIGILVVKSNHKMVIKYMMTENTKCELGVEKVMDGNLTCAGRTIDKIIKATVSVLSNIKSPFDITKPGVYSAGNTYHYSENHSVGIVTLGKVSEKQIVIGTCYKTNPDPKNASCLDYFKEYVNFL